MDDTHMAGESSEHEQITSAPAIPCAVRSPPVELVLPLPDFLDCFPAPHIGRIVSGLDVLTRPECGVAPHAVFTFQRCWTAGSARRITWQPADGNQVTVDVPDNVDIKFRVLSSGDGRHCSVAELAAAFPTGPVRVESITSTATVPLRIGERVRLVRLVWRNAEKCVECRRITDRKLIDVPFSCAAEFVEDEDDVQMSFDDLTALCLSPRRRAVQLCDNMDVVIDGLPPGVGRLYGPAGQLYVGLEPTSSAVIVEACPVDDEATLIRLPDADQRILVAPDAPTTLRPGHSLSSFVTNSRNMFPLVVRVVDWKQQTSVLEHHYVRPGVKLVLHGRAQQTKVLAHTDHRRYAVPLTYRGEFERRPRVFAGSRQLLSEAQRGSIVRVIYLHRGEHPPLSLGDRLRVLNNDNMLTVAERKKYVRCERYDGLQRGKAKEVRIPVTSNAGFEEVLEDYDASGHNEQPLNMEQLARLLDGSQTGCGAEIRVRLTRPSLDVTSRRHRRHDDDDNDDDDDVDLPRDTDISLTAVFVEPCVLASVDSADRPAFHLPLRTDIDVRLVRYLDRRDSSPQPSHRRRMSTMDRCVEALYDDDLTAFMTNCHDRDMSTSCKSLSLSTTNHVYSDVNLSDSVEFSLPTDDSRTTTVQSCDTKTRLLTPSPTLFTSNGHSTHVNTHRSPRDSTCSSTDKCASDTHDAIDDGMLSVTFTGGTDDDDDESGRDVDEEGEYRDVDSNSHHRQQRHDKRLKIDTTVSTKAGKFKLRLPDDGNLYNMSAARFADLLDCLRLDAQVSAACRRRRMDGRQFSQLTENEMELSGLLHPVLLHFRRLTVVKKQPPLSWSAVRRN